MKDGFCQAGDMKWGIYKATKRAAVSGRRLPGFDPGRSSRPGPAVISLFCIRPRSSDLPPKGGCLGLPAIHDGGEGPPRRGSEIATEDSVRGPHE